MSNYAETLEEEIVLTKLVERSILLELLYEAEETCIAFSSDDEKNTRLQRVLNNLVEKEILKEVTIRPLTYDAKFLNLGMTKAYKMLADIPVTIYNITTYKRGKNFHEAVNKEIEGGMEV